MEIWQAFVLGAFVALVTLSLVYGALVLEAEEQAYRKGVEDGRKESRKEM